MVIRTQMSEQPQCRERHSFGVVEIDGVVYVLGGEDGDRELISMESYDTCTKTWIKQQNMTMVRKLHKSWGEEKQQHTDSCLGGCVIEGEKGTIKHTDKSDMSVKYKRARGA
ncbi:hypothetical protein AB205_0005300 [Aquarana catesbeiana]|uniref:Uncharacterized protein n=1 Tax=Aquarana catesbeiana TaxID=8400 RepID=A0A2G9PPF7_AQUCT|nr:hypothetical protein AB205_0005300 [Aquarana catesbeiana]